jgi:hypothetical protein
LRSALGRRSVHNATTIPTLGPAATPAFLFVQDSHRPSQPTTNIAVRATIRPRIPDAYAQGSTAARPAVFQDSQVAEWRRDDLGPVRIATRRCSTRQGRDTSRGPPDGGFGSDSPTTPMAIVPKLPGQACVGDGRVEPCITSSVCTPYDGALFSNPWPTTLDGDPRRGSLGAAEPPSGLLHDFDQVTATRHPRPRLVKIGNQHLETGRVQTFA